MIEEEKARLAELKAKTELTAEEKTEMSGLEVKTTTNEKTFTQEQVNNLIKKESAKAVEKLIKDLGVDTFENAKEGIEKLKALEDDKKTDLEKLQEQVKALTDAQSEKETVLSMKNNEVELLKAGVPAEKINTYTKLLNTYDGDDMTVKMESVLKDFPLTPSVPVDQPSNIGGQVGGGSSEKTLEQESADLDAVFGIS